MKLMGSPLSRKRNKHTINGIFSPLTKYLVTQSTYKTVGIGIAFSPNLQANLHEAVRLTRMLQSRLILLHVGEETEDKKKQVSNIIAGESGNPINYSIKFIQGKPVSSILRAITIFNIDLLLLGALVEEKFVKYYVGSIARKITRKASCSILLMIHPAVNRVPCRHIVVNGLEDNHTAATINTACYVANALGTNRLTIVEEIDQEEVSIKVDDDDSLRRANLLKEKLRRKEEQRVHDILEHVPEQWMENLTVATQPIFGKRGYSIGHYAQIVRADLLIMNAPRKYKVTDRLFPHDIEYILNELPTDVLIVR